MTLIEKPRISRIFFKLTTAAASLSILLFGAVWIYSEYHSFHLEAEKLRGEYIKTQNRCLRKPWNTLSDLPITSRINWSAESTTRLKTGPGSLFDRRQPLSAIPRRRPGRGTQTHGQGGLEAHTLQQGPGVLFRLFHGGNRGAVSGKTGAGRRRHARYARRRRRIRGPGHDRHRPREGGGVL